MSTPLPSKRGNVAGQSPNTLRQIIAERDALLEAMHHIADLSDGNTTPFGRVLGEIHNIARGAVGA
jgi:hypothetical protein